jgi:predicted NUDIX family phosphoesterase
VAKEEKVLVVERKVFDELGAFNGLCFDAERYMKRLFAPSVSRFMPRPAAEKDPSYKQLIPYVIMTCGDKYLTYVRGKRAGETRLVAKRSMGIGGHINPVDDRSLLGGSATYLDAVVREVDEEVSVETPYRDHIVALLNDDTNDVGQVHLGVVHCWVLDAPAVTRREQMITQMEFLSVPELEAVRDSMETWSQLCLDGLDQIRKGLT